MTTASAHEIDRVAPTRRPEAAAVMRQRWARLAFLHWRVAPEEVQRLLPTGLTLDTFDGEAWVGLVPFVVTGARPALLPPVPGLSRFDEVNVFLSASVNAISSSLHGPGVLHLDRQMRG